MTTASDTSDNTMAIVFTLYDRMTFGPKSLVEEKCLFYVSCAIISHDAAE